MMLLELINAPVASCATFTGAALNSRKEKAW